MPVIPRIYFKYGTRYYVFWVKKWRCKCDSTAKGYIEKKRIEWRERTHWNQMQWTTATIFVIRHTMTNSSRKQQLLQQQQHSNTLHSSRQVYTLTYSYVVQQRTNSTNFIIYQVQVLCCETAHRRCLHGVYATKRETATTVISTHNREAAAVAAALCMHTYKTDSRLLRRSLNHHRTCFYTGTNHKKGNVTRKKNEKNTIILDSNHGQHVKGTAT